MQVVRPSRTSRIGMKDLRIAHIADTHLGYKYSVLPARDEDFSRSWMEACEAIVSSSPDLIIHAGDVFHHHRPDWKALSAFTKGLDILREAQVPIFIIAGNHDTSGLHSLHTVFTFTSLVYPGFIITNEYYPTLHHVEEWDLDVVLVPHRALLSKTLATEVDQLVGKMIGSRRILVSHGSISKDDLTSEPGSIAIPHAITDHDWTYMAFGHLHMCQPYGQNGWYSGSTERCGWSDILANPAWTLVELSSTGKIKHTQRSVKHMQFIQLPDCDGTSLSPADIVGDIVLSMDRFVIPEERSHIRVKVTNAERSARYQAEKLIRRAVSKEYPKAVVSVVSEASSIENTFKTPEAVEKTLKPLNEMFRDFIAEQEYKDKDFGERFLERGIEELDKALEELEDGAPT